MYHVLYVDDEPDLLKISKLFLESTGEFSLDTAISAHDGLDSLQNRAYDAVVSDFQMPEMDGIEFLKLVRSKFGSIPFILFTGRGREEVVVEAINNGTDFYVQKGGDPRAQFAELAHKIRQAIARRTAERSRIESEKRLSDIINFLPDATFAIDKAGTVIAWNHAMEEMTGIAASDMMGKGNYEYAIPLYGEPRPMLIDLVFSPPGEISDRYSHIVRDGTMLAAETVLPHLRGEPRTLWGKASPLYDKNGQVAGSIESIRDITDRKKAEQMLAEQYRLLAESESRLKRAEVVAQVGHWEFHMDTGKMLASENAGAIYGVKSLEMPIPDVQKIPLPEYRRALDDALNALIQRGEPYELDFKIRRPADGALRDIHSIATYDPEKRVVFGIIHDITELKKTETELAATNEQLTAAEEELREQYNSLANNQRALAASEEKYRAILENIQDVYYRTDVQGTLVMISPSGAGLLGYGDAGEMTGRPATDYYADPVQREDLLLALKKDGAVFNREVTLKRKDGSPVPVSTSSHTYYDADGNYAGVEGIFRDITKIRQAERELRAAYEQITAAEEELRGQYEELARSERQLRENEENFQRMVESAPDAIYISIGEHFAYVNPAMVRLLGAASADQLIGMSLYDRIDPQYRNSIHERARIVIGEQKPLGHEETVYLKMDGTPVTVESSVALFRYRNQFAGLVILRDITGHKKAEQALREQEQKYRAVIEATGTGFVILDEEGRVLDANPEYVRLAGHKNPNEIAGRNVTEWTAGYDKERNAEAVRQCMRTGFIRNLEIDYVDASGRITPVEINASVIRSGDAIRVLALCRDITERRQMGNELELLKISVDHAYDEVFWLDFEGNFLYVNDSACRITGYSREEFRTMKIYDLDPDCPPKDSAAVLDNLRKKKTLFTTSRHRCKDGRIVDVEIVSVYVRKDGREYSFAFVRDITERRGAEKALKESEKRYRDMFEINNAVMFIVDPETGKIVAANAAACRYYGYSREEFARLVIMEINIQDPAVTLKDMAHARVEEGAVFQFRHRKKNGEIRDVEVFSAPITQEGHQYLHSIIQDVTDRRRAQEALKESEQKFRDIFNNSTDAIYLHEIMEDGTPGRFTDVNEVACRMLGYTREELLEKSPLDIAPGYHNPPREKVFEDQQTLGIARFETEQKTKGGTLIPVEVNTHVVTIQGRKVILAVVRDITARKRAEEAIRLANKKLNLLSGITRHDIKNQLTALLEYIDLSKMILQGPDLKKTIDKEEGVAHNILRQIEFTKEYEDLGASTPSWQNVKKCIDLGIKGLDLSGTELNVTGLDNVEIIADSLLQKVFFNLVDNALRYSGKAKKTVRISSHESGEGFVIVCEDDGSGIPVHEKDLIFERGYGKNTGLGLFLIREILATTGITIKETGGPGKGARFEMFVPKGGYRFTPTR
jgi:PAS domain S-box-containing protein